MMPIFRFSFSGRTVPAGSVGEPIGKNSNFADRVTRVKINLPA